MTLFRNAKIRKQIALLERRRAHLDTRNRGSWDESESAALGAAVDAMKQVYPEHPTPLPEVEERYANKSDEWLANNLHPEWCNVMETHDGHRHIFETTDGVRHHRWCGGYLKFDVNE